MVLYCCLFVVWLVLCFDCCACVCVCLRWFVLFGWCHVLYAGFGCFAELLLLVLGVVLAGLVLV